MYLKAGLPSGFLGDAEEAIAEGNCGIEEGREPELDFGKFWMRLKFVERGAHELGVLYYCGPCTEL